MQCSLRPNNFISFVWGRQNSLVFTPFCSTSGSVQNNRSPHFHQFCFQQHEEHAILIGGATCSRQHFAINPCSFYLSCAQEHHRFQSTRFALYLNELSYFGVGSFCRTGGRGIATDTESTLVSSSLCIFFSCPLIFLLQSFHSQVRWPRWRVQRPGSRSCESNVLVSSTSSRRRRCELVHNSKMYTHNAW